MPMSPYKKESDMKALVSIRIADNVAEEEVPLIFIKHQSQHNTFALSFVTELGQQN